MDIIIPASFDAHPRHRSKVEAAGLGNADVLAIAVAGSFAEGIAGEPSDVDLGYTSPRRPSNGPSARSRRSPQPAER